MIFPVFPLSVRQVTLLLKCITLVRYNFPFIHKPPVSIERPQWGLPGDFSGLNNPSLLSLSSHEKCSSTLIIFVVLYWTCFDRFIFGWRSQSCLQCSEKQSREEESPPMTCWSHCFVSNWFSGLETDTVGSCKVFISQCHSHLHRTALNPFISQSILISGISLLICIMGSQDALLKSDRTR